MAIIALTQGKVAIVDDEDLEMLSAFKWHCAKLGAGKMPYAACVINSRRVLMHRMLLGLDLGNPMMGDHINGDGLDNRRSNIRAVDRSGNMKNRKIAKNNTSGKVGLYWSASHGSKGAWMAYVGVDGRLVSTKFGCARVGSEAAYAKACEWRDRKERELGITVRAQK